VRDVVGLLARAKNDQLRFSDRFPDANASLAECSRRYLEGGARTLLSVWHARRLMKVETAGWKAANWYRGKLVEKSKDRTG
jgi:hypothetical protein